MLRLFGASPVSSRPAPAGSAPGSVGRMSVASWSNPREETILVVEDEEPILDLVSTALRFAGFQVTTATSGREALRLAAGTELHLLVLDVNLPDLDGFEVCRRLRAEGHHVPVVFLT